MSIIFKGTTIPCRVLRHEFPGPESQTVITHFWGVNGASAIDGGIGPRPFELPIILFNDFDTREKLDKFIKETLIDKLQNKTGELKLPVRGGERPTRSFGDCKLIRHIVLNPGALPPGNLIGVDDDGWFCYVMLQFIQLTV